MLKSILVKKNKPIKPAMKIRSGISAGGSVDACMKNLNYWQKAYTERCGVLK